MPALCAPQSLLSVLYPLLTHLPVLLLAMITKRKQVHFVDPLFLFRSVDFPLFFSSSLLDSHFVDSCQRKDEGGDDRAGIRTDGCGLEAH